MMEKRLLKKDTSVRTRPQGINPDALRKKHQEMKQRSSNKDFKSIFVEGFNQYIPRDGDNQIRIVPPLEVAELEFFAMDVYFHRNVGVAGDIFLCLKRMGMDSYCQICKQQTAKLWEEDREKAISLYPEEKSLVWVIDLLATEEEIEKKGWIQPWLCPKTKVMHEILSHSHRKENDVYIDVSHPTDGRIIYFDKKGKGVQTVYSGIQISDSPYPLPDGWEKHLVNFTEALVINSQEEIKASIELQEVEGGQGTHDRVPEASANREYDSGQSEQEIPHEQEQLPDCFGKLYGEYQDCGHSCPDSNPCLVDFKKSKEPVKPLRPSRPAATQIVSKSTDENPQPDKMNVSAKLKEAMERKKTDAKSTVAPRVPRR